MNFAVKLIVLTCVCLVIFSCDAEEGPPLFESGIDTNCGYGRLEYPDGWENQFQNLRKDNLSTLIGGMANSLIHKESKNNSNFVDSIDIELSAFLFTDFSKKIRRIACAQITLLFEFDVKADSFKYVGYRPITLKEQSGNVTEVSISVEDLSDFQHLQVRLGVKSIAPRKRRTINLGLLKIESNAGEGGGALGYSTLCFIFDTHKWVGGRSLVLLQGNIQCGDETIPIFSDEYIPYVKDRQGYFSRLFRGENKHLLWGTYQVLQDGLKVNEFPYRPVSVYEFASHSSSIPPK
jgi:hypothetical protein